MTALQRARRIPLGAEVALAFSAGAASFTLVAVAVTALDSDVLLVVLAALCVAGVLAIARFCGVAYAIPVALASLLAYDWFQFPPTHPREFPDSANLADLLLYLGVAVFVGELAAHAGRRAAVSEVARGELAEAQAALRRVATLVAREVPPDDVFLAAAEEVEALSGVDAARIVRYVGDDEVVQLDGTKPRGPGGELRSPIVVDGRAWGAILAWSPHGQPLPDTAESRVSDFAELIATAIAKAQARAEVERLADQQAALRRVATGVAQAVPAHELLAAVAEEAGTLLDVDGTRIARYEGDELVHVSEWSKPGHTPPPFERAKLEGTSVSAEVRRTGRVARIDDYRAIEDRAAFAQGVELRSVVGAPIAVEGRRWGVMLAWSAEEALPSDVEARLTDFTELVATAISNTEARAEVAQLAEEQAALRRVATLVAHGVPPVEVFTAVAREVGQLLGVSSTHMARCDPDGTVTGVGSWSPDGTHIAAGTRVALDATSVVGLVMRSGRPARKESYHDASDEVAAMTRELEIQSSVGAPISVDGRVWGVMVASSSEDQPLPADTESRIAAFTELVATAISNTEARAEVAQLAEDQAALRRVATLVAQGVPPGEFFGAVAEEVGSLLAADVAGMIRYESDDTVCVVATWAAANEQPEVGGRWPLDAAGLATTIWRTGGPARMDDYEGIPANLAIIREELGIRGSVGSPIVVEGRLWGALLVHSTQPEPLPADTESRLLNFSELVGTAISNAQARAEVHRLAEEQAALRRVATLVARESPPAEVFTKVAEEVGLLLGAESAWMHFYEPDGSGTVVGTWGELGTAFPLGTRLTLEGESVTALVRETRRPARIDDHTRVSGSVETYASELGIRSAVAGPIMVEGRLWGAMVAATRGAEPLPAGAESRIGEFTELVATAISNIQARSELAASRARIVAAADDERRRLVRDLHDGAQQQMVHTIVTLKLAQRALENGDETPAPLVAEALHEAERATAELRELSHGILPSVLTRGGLRAGVEALAARMPVPVDISVSVDRLPAPVEATAYFLVAEALTNVAKHAHAAHATVTARVEDGTLRIRVRDDGVGGARPEGSGLVGLADRLAVLDGQLRVESPAQGGTLVAAAIPLVGQAG